MDPSKFPLIPLPLLKALEDLYPNRCPDLNTPDREIWFKAGQAAVVQFLKTQYERQTTPTPAKEN